MVKYAILPVKNNSSGNIKETNKLLKKNKFFIKKKIIMNINHCLISAQKNSFQNIKLIYSHIEPIKQCQLFIKKFPLWKIKYTNSSSEAIKKISQKKKKYIAAIGNKESCILYNLYIIKKNISNHKKNKTLFYVLKKNH
ncbi:prephenate dehydratase domain-containing protein [Buchnera aphidicola]|uniref:prephenate dehydratase domain-containing protein n=1 Tax=Buchnera aphidicola TaxID=9 RepID=UPI0034638E4E